MNREIKFRGKRVNGGEWVIGSYVHLDYHSLDYVEAHQIILTNGHSFEVIPETVGQFTGLKDKNGKEIYEGDIVVTKAEETPMVIGWKQRLSSFCIDKKGWLSSHYFGEAFDGEYCEIIGNIHDNHSLLEDK